MPGDTYRLGAGVVEHVGGDVNGLAVNLVGPSTVVADARNNGTNIATGHGDGLSVVERLDGGEEVDVLLSNIGELEHQLAALVCAGLAPCRVESLAGGGDSQVDILLGSLVDGDDRLLS